MFLLTVRVCPAAPGVFPPSIPAGRTKTPLPVGQLVADALPLDAVVVPPRVGREQNDPPSPTDVGLLLVLLLFSERRRGRHVCMYVLIPVIIAVLSRSRLVSLVSLSVD